MDKLREVRDGSRENREIPRRMKKKNKESDRDHLSYPDRRKVKGASFNSFCQFNRS